MEKGRLPIPSVVLCLGFLSVWRQGCTWFKAHGPLGSCPAGCVNWTEFLFLPGGQTKVSLSLVAAAITAKRVGSPSPHASSGAGGCGPEIQPQLPGSLWDRAPMSLSGRPTSHENKCTWRPTEEDSLFLLLVYWPRELDTHTQMRR